MDDLESTIKELLDKVEPLPLEVQDALNAPMLEVTEEEMIQLLEALFNEID